jgi:hypothetical protein
MQVFILVSYVRIYVTVHLSRYPLKNARFEHLWSFILRLINLVNKRVDALVQNR